jgi:hypothetical protein
MGQRIGSLAPSTSSRLAGSFQMADAASARAAPLDANNWQQGRTPRIVVQNDHPSVYMQFAGMGA